MALSILLMILISFGLYAVYYFITPIILIIIDLTNWRQHGYSFERRENNFVVKHVNNELIVMDWSMEAEKILNSAPIRHYLWTMRSIYKEAFEYASQRI